MAKFNVKLTTKFESIETVVEADTPDEAIRLARLESNLEDCKFQTAVPILNIKESPAPKIASKGGPRPKRKTAKKKS